MKLLRVLLGVAVLGGVTVVAVVSKNTETSGSRMVSAAEKFLGTLDAKQKAKAVFDFDSKERINWNFVPLQTNDPKKEDRKSTRKGLPLEDMSAEQRQAALELLKAGTSAAGYQAATTIMSLEKVLRDLEKTGQMVRNPDWYFFTVFGTPSKTGKWGFRVEGHHLSLNFTLEKGAVVSATPAFFGANPATIKAGPRQGERTLPGAEKYAQELFDSLDDEQKKAARQSKQFPEIEQHVASPGVGPAKGLPAAKMTEKQQKILDRLIKDYADRLPEDIAAVELDRLQKAGFDKVHFAFAREEDKAGKPCTYRVQGPTFVIEFLNVQADSANNPANHIHSSWRNLDGDFGMTKN
jgi:hypothetical protein